MSSPWPLLVEAIARTTRAQVKHAHLVAHGLSPDELMARGLVERLSIEDTWTPSGCTENCLPDFDFESRICDGLFGARCVNQIGCTAGVEWYRVQDAERFRCSAARIVEGLRAANRLAVLDSKGTSPLFVPIGQIAKRGLVVPVLMFDGPTGALEDASRGLRARLRGDGLIVLVAEPPARTSFEADERIVLWPMRADASGDLGLGGALDRIDPTWKTRRLSDRDAVFDDVRIGFATEPGKRHVVTIDGHELAGFQRSDLKFVRLLRLAVERRENLASDGWLGKHTLHGDEKDHDLEALRAELRKGEHPTLAPEERAALIKSSATGDGRVRLAMEIEKIEIDASLSGFQLLQAEIAATTASSANVRARAAAVNAGVATARKLWAAVARKLETR